MSAVGMLRGLIRGRLTAAAEEISGVVGKTVIEREKGVKCQHELLESILKPQVRLRRLDPDQYPCKKEDPSEPKQDEDVDESDLSDSGKMTQIESKRSPKKQQTQSSCGKKYRFKSQRTQTNKRPCKKEEPEPIQVTGKKYRFKSRRLRNRTAQTYYSRCKKEEPEPSPVTRSSRGKKYLFKSQKSTNRRTQTDKRPWKKEEVLNNCEMSSPDQEEPEPSQMAGEQEKGELLGPEQEKDGDNSDQMDREDVDKLYHCYFCGKNYRYNSQLEMHMRVHTGEKPFSCSVCGKRFAVKQTMSKHMRTHTGERPYACSICPKTFSNGTSLKTHFLRHAGEKQLSCGICGKTFASKSELKAHMEGHIDEEPSFNASTVSPVSAGYNCYFCGKHFLKRSWVVSHMKTHEDESPSYRYKIRQSLLQQSACKRKCEGGAENSDPASRVSPLMTNDGQSEAEEDLTDSAILGLKSKHEPYTCSVCGEKYLFKSRLSMHMRTHTGEKAHFTYERGMRRRCVLPDSNQKPTQKSDGIECEEEEVLNGQQITGPDQGQPQPPQIREEQEKGEPSEPEQDEDGDDSDQSKSDHGYKSHVCRFCGKKFVFHSWLMSHLKLHSGDEPFSCRTCGKKFSCKLTLNLHMSCHKGERPSSAALRVSPLMTGVGQSAAEEHLPDSTMMAPSESKCKPRSSSFCGEKTSSKSQRSMHMTLLTYKNKKSRQHVSNPRVELDRIDQRDCKEEEVLNDQQIWGPVQEQPKPPQMKEEPEELVKVEGEPLEPKQQEEDAGNSEAAMGVMPLMIFNHQSDDQNHLANSAKWKTLLEDNFLNGQQISRAVQKKPDPPPVKEEKVELFINAGQELLDPKVEDADNSDPARGVSPLITNDGSSTVEENLPDSAMTTPSESHHEAYNCSFCGNKYTLKLHLVKHMRCHTGEGSSSTAETRMKHPDVDEEYADKSDQRECKQEEVLNDQQISSPDQEQPQPSQIKEEQEEDEDGSKSCACPFCGRTFLWKSRLDRHIRVHTGEKPYCCSICGKRFSREMSLTVHMATHSDKRPFSCDTCGKSFKHKSSFKTHLLIHTDKKPFPCSMCSMKFRLKAALTLHMRVHRAKEPCSCNICGMKFTLKTALTLHMRSHTVEKRYSCNICGNKFLHEGSLYAHMKVHTGEKRFYCGSCRTRFRDSHEYTAHIRTHNLKVVSHKEAENPDDNPLR